MTGIGRREASLGFNRSIPVPHRHTDTHTHWRQPLLDSYWESNIILLFLTQFRIQFNTNRLMYCIISRSLSDECRRRQSSFQCCSSPLSLHLLLHFGVFGVSSLPLDKRIDETTNTFLSHQNSILSFTHRSINCAVNAFYATFSPIIMKEISNHNMSPFCVMLFSNSFFVLHQRRERMRSERRKPAKKVLPLIYNCFVMQWLLLIVFALNVSSMRYPVYSGSAWRLRPRIIESRHSHWMAFFINKLYKACYCLSWESKNNKHYILDNWVEIRFLYENFKCSW